MTAAGVGVITLTISGSTAISAVVAFSGPLATIFAHVDELDALACVCLALRQNAAMCPVSRHFQHVL